MCGIAGIVYSKAEIYKPNLLKMVSRISHRGPDAEGIALFKKCFSVDSECFHCSQEYFTIFSLKWNALAGESFS